MKNKKCRDSRLKGHLIAFLSALLPARVERTKMMPAARTAMGKRALD
jgi:hypothetical protein